MKIDGSEFRNICCHKAAVITRSVRQQLIAIRFLPHNGFSGFLISDSEITIVGFVQDGWLWFIADGKEGLKLH